MSVSFVGCLKPVGRHEWNWEREQRFLPERSEHRTLTLRSRQTLQERDWRLDAFLARKSRAGSPESPAMGSWVSMGEGEITVDQRRCGI